MSARLLGALLAVALSVAVAGIASAARSGRGPVNPRKGAHYTGKSNQGQPFSFDISANGQRVLHPIFHLVTRCFGGGNSYAQTSKHATATASGPVKRGRFHLRFTEHAVIKPGVDATASFSVGGHFASARHALGSARVTVRYTNHVKCVSGAVGFSVKS